MKKVDLHIHTVPTIKDANFTFDMDKMQLYVQTLKLDAIAITNHNLFDKNQFDEIKNKLNITVFPGIEVDLENGHIIVIADADSLDKFDDQCNLLKEKIVDNKSVITYDEFISIFTNYEEYLLVPHYKKKPAMQQSILKKFGKNITCGEVDNIKKFCVLKKQQDDLVPLLSSDVRIKKDLENFPTRFTFLDINDTSLKVIIGKRSSGKTYTLNMIKNTFDTSDVKYIKQFEITEKSGQDKFEKITKVEYEKITNEYISPIANIMPYILEIDLEEDNTKLENYHSSLINRALNSERNDIFSKSSMFNEITFDTKTNNELVELINAIKILLDNDTYKEIIEKNIIEKTIIKIY